MSEVGCLARDAAGECRRGKSQKPRARGARNKRPASDAETAIAKRSRRAWRQENGGEPSEYGGHRTGEPNALYTHVPSQLIPNDFCSPSDNPALAPLFGHHQHCFNNPSSGMQVGYATQSNGVAGAIGESVFGNAGLLPPNVMAYGVQMTPAANFSFGCAPVTTSRGGVQCAAFAAAPSNMSWCTDSAFHSSERSLSVSTESFLALPDASESGESVEGSSVGAVLSASGGVAGSATARLPPHWETFCVVPSRTCLLGPVPKYEVSVGELVRRISPPECLNASLLGALLRKAKSKEGGKALRCSLMDIGLSLPSGRRRTAEPTAFTSFVEGEALRIAKDFANLCENEFPSRAVAEHVFNTGNFEHTFNRLITIRNTRAVVRELAEVVNADRSALCGQQPPQRLPAALQKRLTNFSMLTHGFGGPALVAVLDTIIDILDEMLLLCDRDYPPPLRDVGECAHSGGVMKVPAGSANSGAFGESPKTLTAGHHVCGMLRRN